ncbi:uncharacterized protein KD926_008594 [Aspergillus affinis]|uniref:uncharacterized protein n=1 Tax=Aspergillus affinis TaxID=1070780 RepID=UPI0022FEB73C|nr:uncharacterized protein KD926_008594 [Aspergillus affinis]KAI9040149.1 hypothetical protein KD926_008594 [Aspergillus affinis]
MSTTSELRNFDLNWTFDAASSLPAVDCSPLDWPLDLDDLDIMRFDMPSLENSAGHLSCTSQGSPLQYPTNATSRPKHFLHNTNSLNQYHETHSIAPHRPKQQCVPWDLTRSSLAIPTNAHMNPKHGHHQLGRNIIDHSANRTESRPKHSSAAFVDGVGEMKKIPTKSAVTVVVVMEGNEDLVLAEADCELQYKVLLHDLEDPGAPGDPRDLWDTIDYPELPADPLADPAPSEPVPIAPVDPCLMVPETNPEATLKKRTNPPCLSPPVSFDDEPVLCNESNDPDNSIDFAAESHNFEEINKEPLFPNLAPPSSLPRKRVRRPANSYIRSSSPDPLAAPTNQTSRYGRRLRRVRQDSDEYPYH